MATRIRHPDDSTLPQARLHNFPTFRQALGKWLEHARVSANLSLSQLSAATGVSINRISRLALGGADVVTVWEVFLICQVLGPTAPPIPFMPAPSSVAAVMKLVRSLKPAERDDLVVSCYSTVEGARVDVAYSRDHEEWPLVLSEEMLAKLQRKGLAWKLEDYDEEPDDSSPNRAVCVRTYVGNAVAEILGREMF